MPKTFWKDRRVFLTGHTGFKGSWLSLWLQRLGAQVTGYALPPNTNPSLFEMADVEHGISSIFGDIRDKERLQKAMQASDPEVIFHLAAQPLVRESYEAPVDTFDVNVMGTVQVLEAIRQFPEVKSVVIVTTDKCYLNNESNWSYREDDPLGGADPYSASKACTELVVGAYRNSYFFEDSTPNIATARAGNVIGGGDYSKDRLVVDLVAAILENRVANIRFPNAVRPWQHVMEPLSGYLLLAERLATEPCLATSWNFGPTDENAKTVAWICDYLKSAWPSHPGWSVDSSDHPHEAGLLKLDSSKAHRELGWKPSLNIRQALDLVVQWNLSVDKVPPRDRCLQEIRIYEDLVSRSNQ